MKPSSQQELISAALAKMVTKKKPNNPKRIPLETALAPHREEIRDALKKGYDWDMIATDISAAIKREISPSTLKRIVKTRDNKPTP